MRKFLEILEIKLHVHFIDVCCYIVECVSHLESTVEQHERVKSSSLSQAAGLIRA